MACCPQESHGRADAAEGFVPKGVEVELGGATKLKCYLAEPNSPRGKALLVLHDVFGPDSGRTKAIIDQYAEEGYVVLMPYVLQNEPFDERNVVKKGLGSVFTLLRMIAWLQPNRWSRIESLYEDIAIPYLLGDKRVESIGLVAFCWGGFSMTHLLASSTHKSKLKGGVGFHLSLQVFKGVLDFSVKSYLQQCEVPVAYLAAKSDPADIKPGGVADLVMKTKGFYSKCVFKEYEDMIHGWVNRGDLSDEMVRRDFEDAMRVSLAFFTKNL